MEKKRSSLAANLKSLDERVSPDIEAVLRKPADPAPARTGSKVAPSRQGKKLLLVPIDPAVHKRLKHLAVDKEVSIESMVRAAIDAMLANEGS